MVSFHTLLQVNLVDRAMSVMMVPKKRLQLLGCACLLIASKYEEVDPPRVKEFVYISDDTYKSFEIKAVCVVSRYFLIIC